MSSITKLPCDEAGALASPVATPCVRSAAPWILGATILGSSMVFIDGTVANIALPALQHEFNASAADAQWVIESFALLLSALLLLGGALGDRYGYRNVFSAGAIVFTLASVWCGLAPSIEQLILARASQGFGAALLVPSSLAIVSRSFAEAERGKAIGTWSAFTAISTALGPVLGGYLIDHFSWRYAFLINIPIGALVLLITAWRIAPDSKQPGQSTLDWAGALLATLGLGGVTFALIESSTRAWTNPVVLSALLTGLIAIVAFVFVEQRARAPMLPLGLLASRSFSTANGLTLLLYAALGGCLYFLPLNLLQVQGYTTTQAGTAMLPFVLCLFLLSNRAGALSDRFGAKPMLVVGPVVTGLGFLLLMMPNIGGSYWLTFFPGLLAIGLGMAATVAPLTTTVMNSVDKAAAGTAAGINNAISRVGALLAIAILGITMTYEFNHTLDAKFSSTNVSREARHIIDSQREKLGAVVIPDVVPKDTQLILRGVIDDAFVSGFRIVMACGAFLAIASGALALVGLRNTPRTPAARTSS